LGAGFARLDGRGRLSQHGFSHHLHWSGILCHNGICGQQRDSFYRRLSHKETIEWILVDGWQTLDGDYVIA
jgi:hypothetical protein